MKNDELISIIIPVYNCEQYLKMCLESVIKQSYTNLDIIIIDDGSTDNSGYICDLYSSKDTRIRVVHKVNEGQGVARNIGYKLSKGKFIVYIDGDDIVNERLIEILVDIYHKSNVDIVSTMLLEFDREVPDVQIINNPKVNYINKYEIMRGFIEDYGYLFHVVCGKLIKKELLKNICFPNTRAIEDEFFLNDLYLNANSMACIETSLYYYRQTANSTMRGDFNINRSLIVFALVDCKTKFKTLIDDDLLFVVQGKILLESAFWYKEILKYSKKTNKNKLKELRHIFIDNFVDGLKSKNISIQLKTLIIINFIYPKLYMIITDLYERMIK